jgi:His/Glu/Gln/Arg/opine family amino acid ABC transporter permease subunit
MDLTRLVDVALFMAPAALTTLVVAAIAFPLALSFAVIITVPRIVRLPDLSFGADFYVDFIRTTPLLLHLFFIFYALPFIGIRLDPLPAGILTIGLHVAAYQSEILKAAYRAVPVGVIEAAQVLGMSRRVRLVRVVIPLSLRIALPGLANSMIEILLDTVVLSVVTVVEIFYSRTLYFYQFYSGRLEGLLIITIFFVAVGVPMGRLVKRLERHVALPGQTDSEGPRPAVVAATPT